MKLRLFVLLAALYLLLASREQPWGDAHVVYDTTQNLVEQARIDVNLGGPPQFYSIRNGKKYGVFPMGNVIAHIPSYLAYRAWKFLPHKPATDELVFRFTSHLTSSLLMAGLCVLFMTMARRQGASERTSVALALLAGCSTILAVYARVPYSEALQTLAFTWVVERALAVGDSPTVKGGLWLGVACGLLFNTKLVYAASLPVVPIYILWLGVSRRRGVEALTSLFAAGVPLLLLTAFAVWHNHLKTGTLLDTGYRIPEGVFSGDAYAALHGFFLSTGKSIFLYSPPLVLAVLAFPSWLRQNRPHALFVLCFTGLVVALNAKFRYWHADYCWGPRLLVPLTAVWLLPVASWIDGALARGRARLRALALGGLVGTGIFVQLLGGSFYWDHWIRVATAVKDQTGAAGWYTEDLHHCHFIPQFSPIIGHAWLLRHVLRDDANLMEDAPWKRVVPGKVNLYSEWSGTRIDWWALDWKKVPAARGWMWGLGLVLAGLSAGAGVGLWRRSGRPGGGRNQRRASLGSPTIQARPIRSRGPATPSAPSASSDGTSSTT